MFQPKSLRILLFLGTACAISTGCGEPPAIRQYEVASESEQDFTSELLRREFRPIPFEWNVPDNWKLASNDQFSVRAWNAGPPAAQARITLGQFPARTGIPAQVMRWRRQLGMESDDADLAMQHVTPLKTQNQAGSFVKVEGQSETILAFILPIESQFWIFRLRGPNATTADEEDRFREFCESLKHQQAAGDSATSADDTGPSSADPGPDSQPSPDARPTADSTEPDAASTSGSAAGDPAPATPENTTSTSDEAGPAAPASPEGE